MSLCMKFEECNDVTNKCQNGGTCEANGVCKCDEDFTGENCETKSKYLEPWMYSLFEKYFWNKWHLLI